MKLIIDRTGSIERTTEITKIKWSISQISSIKIICYYLIVGVSIVTIGIVNKIQFMTTFGLASCLVALYLIYQLVQQKKYFFKSIDSYIHRIKTFKYYIEINDEYLKYGDEELFEEIKWSRFSSFYIKDEFIFILSGDNIFSAITISKSELTNMEFQDLFHFLEKKLIYARPSSAL